MDILVKMLASNEDACILDTVIIYNFSSSYLYRMSQEIRISVPVPKDDMFYRVSCIQDSRYMNELE